MIPPATLLAFTLTSILFVVIPGPSVLFVIGRALSLGRVGALLSVVGNALGFVVQIIAIALGLGVLIESSIVLFTAVKIAGALFLIYLGVQAIRHRTHSTAVVQTARVSKWRSLSEGAVVGATNPKSIVFFIAVLPQFVTVSVGNVPLQLALLGFVFAGLAVLSDSVWALSASAARTWFARSPRRMESMGIGGGVAMIGLGGAMAVSGTK
ncbi:MAG TPA: LysE family translocator [Glaciihabitans sp.]|jgi:threonine/homoserine/homoserine lactone efflux protein|nr:LysE family translocator [Glaciihabitans sp.]